MPKIITLKMTRQQYDAVIQMIEENAIMAGCSDDEFRKSVDKNLTLINRMLKNNNINHTITY